MRDNRSRDTDRDPRRRAGRLRGGACRAQLGAEVTVVDRDGLGGSAVLTDCVRARRSSPAEVMTEAAESAELGVVLDDAEVGVDLVRVNSWVKALAEAQSRDVAGSLEKAGVQVFAGPAGWRWATGCWRSADGSPRNWSPTSPWRPRPQPAASTRWPAGTVLTRTDPGPRASLPFRPSSAPVLGQPEFAGAYNAFWSEVVLVSSRDHVLPARTRTPRTCSRRCSPVVASVCSPGRGRRQSADRRRGRVTLIDGTVVEGSHCLMAVGSVPSTEPSVGRVCVRLDNGGYVEVDRVCWALGARRLRCRRLHRGADARIGGGHAGPNRHACARRRRGAARPQDRVLHRVHRTGDSDGRLESGRGRRRRDRCPRRQAPAGHQRGQRCRASTTAS